MKDTDETAFLNSLFMDFTSENELELFLKSLDEELGTGPNQKKFLELTQKFK